MRIAYFFTTFPVISETFLQREIRAMRKLPVQIEIFSLHGGDTEFEGLPVKCFRKRELLKLLWALPIRLIERPRVLLHIAEAMQKNRMPCCMNFWETLLGIAFALVYTPYFRKNKPDLFHAVWATMPATAAMLLREYTHVPFTMGAHAYDVFRHGGDWLLPEKLITARMIHTTTEATRTTLIERGASAGKVALIRRGLHYFPSMKSHQACNKPLRIVSIGRLVEKKAYFEQFALYDYLRNQGFEFEARIIGTGKQEKALRLHKKKLNLDAQVLMLGRRDYSGVLEQLDWADAMIFTGKVTQDGDRDGLPNVIPEAMAVGVPVISTPVSGVPEAIKHEQTGMLVELNDFSAWHKALKRLRDDENLRARIRTNARAWTLENFCAHKNATELAEKLRHYASLDMSNRHNPYLSDAL